MDFSFQWSNQIWIAIRYFELCASAFRLPGRCDRLLGEDREVGLGTRDFERDFGLCGSSSGRTDLGPDLIRFRRERLKTMSWRNEAQK